MIPCGQPSLLKWSMIKLTGYTASVPDPLPRHNSAAEHRIKFGLGRTIALPLGGITMFLAPSSFEDTENTRPVKRISHVRAFIPPSWRDAITRLPRKCQEPP